MTLSGFTDQAMAENNSLATFLYVPLANSRLLMAPVAALTDDQHKEGGSQWKSEFSPLFEK